MPVKGSTLSDTYSKGLPKQYEESEFSSSVIHPEEITDDLLLAGKVHLKQPKGGFRAAIDSVLLPAAVNAKPGETVFDIGAGCGAASLCLARRVNDVDISGIEIQPHLVQLADENICTNELIGRVKILIGDVAQSVPDRYQGQFDHVMLNPPYIRNHQSPPHAAKSKSIANIEGSASLETWIKYAFCLLRHKGTVTMIHRTDRLDDIIIALGPRGCKFGGIIVCPLWPRKGASAKRVIVKARKGVATPLEITSGLVLHADDGNYTETTIAILGGEPLEL